MCVCISILCTPLVEFKLGEIVSLKSGSMKMVVELIEGDRISTVWCNGGLILRDKFSNILLKKWDRPDEEYDKSKDKKFSQAGKEKKGFNSRNRSDKERVRTGWDGKAREKKFFRKG